MPSFQCSVCQSSFEIAQAALDKYPGWEPKFCREHSPKRKTASSTAKGRSGGSKVGRTSGGGARGGAPREEFLTLDQVLAKYTGGPSSGVFTDGSSVPNPGPGGWGVVWVEDGEVREQRHGKDPDTTNNRMELRALIEAFQLLPEGAEVTVYTDSQLCVNTITQWAPKWEKAGWKKKSGPIKNLELVQELLALARSRPGGKLEWIAAHSGHRWNEYADSLATAWMRGVL